VSASVLRGWKEICTFLHVADKRTARRILVKLGLYHIEGNKPVLFKDAYNKALHTFLSRTKHRKK
jgi:hypothetical protein